MKHIGNIRHLGHFHGRMLKVLLYKFFFLSCKFMFFFSLNSMLLAWKLAWESTIFVKQIKIYDVLAVLCSALTALCQGSPGPPSDWKTPETQRVILRATMDSSARIPSKISKGERCMRWNLEKTMHELPPVLCRWSFRTCLTPPVRCQDICEVLSPSSAQ